MGGILPGTRNVDRASASIASREFSAPARHAPNWICGWSRLLPSILGFIIIRIRRGRRICHSLGLGVVVLYPYQPVHHSLISIDLSFNSWLLLVLHHERWQLPPSDQVSLPARASSACPSVKYTRTMNFSFYLCSRLLRVTGSSLPYLCPTSQPRSSACCG